MLAELQDAVAILQSDQPLISSQEGTRMPVSPSGEPPPTRLVLRVIQGGRVRSANLGETCVHQGPVFAPFTCHLLTAQTAD